ncbi:hypothetical protein AB0L71_17310 [Streptomyces sp. NPDC052052]|uniref:hypothetical protein n=1 Tax=Streptomyces sp. NPDC052052 TaxID=3154756 RepID=UPI0034315431
MPTSVEREVPPPSMRDLLAACAAATAVSTPPQPSADRAPDAATDPDTAEDSDGDPDTQAVVPAPGRRAG